MHARQSSNVAFKIHSSAESELLSPLVNCSLDTLFKHKPEIAPIALNLYFQEGLSSIYLHLIAQEIRLYAQRFGPQRAAKTWLRGTPLTCLSAAEITEIVFLSASNFQMDEETYSEYGFECTFSDIKENNLALMKGLRFTTILLNIDASLAPKTQQLWPHLDLIKQYKFPELQFRLDTSASDAATLHHWLESLIVGQPQLIELHGLEEMTEPVMLDQLAKLMSPRGYALIGDRFFVLEGHPLLQLKHLGTLQYTPWGLSHPQIKNWVGLGVGALGKIGRGFYQNTDTESEYQSNLTQGKLPIQCSGKYPNDDITLWTLIEQLICLHRTQNPNNLSLLNDNPKAYQVFHQACNKGWMVEDGNYLSVSGQGLNHLREICRNLLCAKN